MHLQLIEAYANVTPIHGIKTIFMLKNRTLQVLWLLILGVALSALIYEVVHIVEDYTSKQIATSLHFEKMSEEDLLKIITPSICFSDWISKSRAKKNNYTKEQLLALDSFSNKFSGRLVQGTSKFPKQDFNITEALSWVRYYQNRMLANLTTLEMLYQQIMKPFHFGHTMDNNRQQFIILADSVCVSIALEPETDIVGVPILRAEIDLHSDDTVTELVAVHDNQPDISLMFYDGLNMRYISEINRIYIPNFSVNSDPSQVNVRLRSHKITTLDREQSPCQTYPEAEKHSKYPINYAKQLYMQKCMDLSVWQPKFNCSCLVPRAHIQQTLDYSDKAYKGFVPCTADVYFEHEFNADPSHLRRCLASSKTQLPTQFCTEWTFAADGMRFVTPKSCRNKGCLNLAIVVNPTLEMSEQIYLMSFETFISNIGGQGGLWFGGSVLSVAHFFFYFIFHGWHKRQSSVARRQQRFKEARLKNNTSSNILLCNQDNQEKTTEKLINHTKQ